MLFFKYFRADLDHPENPANDRFILSKGHASPLLYALYAAIGTPGFTFSRHTSYTFMLVPISVYALWGLVFLYRTRDRLR